MSRFEDHSSRSKTGVKRYNKKPRSFSTEVSSNNTKSPFPGQLAESFWLGNISIYLKPCSSTNLQNSIFSMIEVSFTDFCALYTVVKLEKWFVDFWDSRMLESRLYWNLYPRKKIPIKFCEQFSNTVLCLWELHIAVNYTCLWWVRSVVFLCQS